MKSARSRLLFAATVLVLSAPLSLWAQSAAGKTPASDPEVVSLKLNGVNAVEQQELKASIATDASRCVTVVLTPVCWISKSRYFYRRQYLDRKEFERDPLRIRVFYFKRGYRDAQVDTVVTPRGKNDVAVTFNVVEGPPTLVSDITVTQTKRVLSDEEVAKRLALSKGTPLNLLRVDSSVVFLQQQLWDRGYSDAIVDTTIVVDAEANRATVALEIDPKWRSTISDILIVGNEKISTRTIMKSMSLNPGDIFRRPELLRSQRALYESNLFRRAAIEIPRQGDSAKVILVTVQEAPLREARISTGFNTVDFFQAEGRYTNYNFFGGARRLDVQGAVGNLLANSLSGRFIFRRSTVNFGSDRARYFAPTYNASINVRQPWFKATENEIALSLFTHRRIAPGIFVDKGFGTSATFTREVSPSLPVSANYRFEITQTDAGDVYFCVNYGVCDPPTIQALGGRQRLSPFTLTATANRANDPFTPNRGYRGTVDAEHASLVTGSDFRYNRASADFARYFQIRKRGTAAGHLRLGWVNALSGTAAAVGLVDSDTEILHPRKRFYAGGSRSVRGFGENQLGPRVLTIPASILRRDSSGGACGPAAPIGSCNPNAPGLRNRDFEPRPLGGNIIAEGSAEMRFPLWKDVVVGAAFIDGAYVSQRTNPLLPKSKAAVTPGFGVRYRSPVGPIRVDIGINPGAAETLPVVTESTVAGETRLVTLSKSRLFDPFRSGFRGVLDRVTLHLSIGEAF
ncbi:MAG: BamA/TamA family outer membrane protein [Gemmatimonadaceae bacterium]